MYSFAKQPPSFPLPFTPYFYLSLSGLLIARRAVVPLLVLPHTALTARYAALWIVLHG
ncbi:hypothetical protein M5X05_13845 [Paenibacillus alvei]|uniref:hypothetical protein n=1 Tax=Paenibacillus alvei TaxID=44250 RepID=UPI002283CC6E|nr:hypothetical protein [Paenibacillus alvei]MCY9705284.1 hypothetical protein [Paenibacillus alvei]